MDCYLPLLEAYLAPALLPICLAALGSPHPGLVMRGLELWASLARREQDMETGGESSLATSLVQGDTIARLVAALLAIILRAPDSDRDLELWSPSAAAVLCLAELAAWPQCGAARLLGLHVAQLGAAASLGWAEVHSCLVTLPGLLGMESREDVASLVTSFLPLAPPLLTSHPASYVRRATAAAVARIAQVRRNDSYVSSMGRKSPKGGKRMQTAGQPPIAAASSEAAAASDSTSQLMTLV